MRFHYALKHGTMKLGLYGPLQIDTQTPHKQDELYVIASGSGHFTKTEIEEVSVPTMSSLLKQVLNIGSRILPKTF